jgi:DNA-binding transcriptional LysR family regulator
MELRHLRAFVEVAERRHFGQAAAALYISQPALSQRIQSLESEFAFRLFERTARDVELTDAGQMLLPYATRVLEEEKRTLEAVHALNGGAAGTLRVAYAGSGDPMLPVKAIEQFRRRFPEVVVEATQGASAQNLARVRAKEIDIAFVRLPVVDVDGLELTTIETEPYVLALPSAHPLAGQRRIALKDLGVGPWILFPRELNPAQYDYLVETIETLSGVPVRSSAHVISEEAMIGAVAEGLGICLCTKTRSRQMRVDGVRFRALASDEPVSRLAVAVRSDTGKASVARNFLSFVGELLGARATGG